MDKSHVQTHMCDTLTVINAAPPTPTHSRHATRHTAHTPCDRLADHTPILALALAFPPLRLLAPYQLGVLDLPIGQGGHGTRHCMRQVARGEEGGQERGEGRMTDEQQEEDRARDEDEEDEEGDVRRSARLIVPPYLTSSAFVSRPRSCLALRACMVEAISASARFSVLLLMGRLDLTS